MAVDKPPGMPSVPAPGDAPSVWRTLERQLQCRLWAVHRLDKDASGVLVFARTAESHRALSLAFERRETEKTYLAIVAGRLDPPRGVIDTPLHPARRGRMRPARAGEPGALDAATAYATQTVWERDGSTVSLVEVLPRTGRHHQIRAHFRSAGVPLLFDGIYGWAAGSEQAAPLRDVPAGRLALHASRLVVPAPTEAGRILIESPLPADLRALVRWLDYFFFAWATSASSRRV